MQLDNKVPSSLFHKQSTYMEQQQRKNTAHNQTFTLQFRTPLKKLLQHLPTSVFSPTACITSPELFETPGDGVNHVECSGKWCIPLLVAKTKARIIWKKWKITNGHSAGRVERCSIGFNTCWACQAVLYRLYNPRQHLWPNP